MKNKYIRNSKGLSLVELIVTLALIGITIFIVANFLFFANRTQKATSKEYAMQSDIRRTTEIANELVRYSKAVFAVPETFVASTDVMDPGWSYLMVSLDSKRIVTMEYDEDLDKHVEKISVSESEDILYYIEFEKDKEAKGDSVLRYKIYAYNTDKNGNKTNEKLVFESTVEAVNAIQVADKGTEAFPSVALAFRSDGHTSGKGKNQRAYITIIVDISNSMNLTPSDGGSTSRETKNSRITKVREALVGDGSPSGTGIIQQFGKEENVFISFIPFANTANSPIPHANLNPDEIHPEYEVYDSTELNALLTQISSLKANGHESNKYGSGQGGTNTGDGLRRSYYLHENHRERNNIDPKDQVHHYIIMLVDGETTFEASYVDWEDEGYYTKPSSWWGDVTEIINGIKYTRFNWTTDWDYTMRDELLSDGNISTSTSNIEPNSDPLIRDNYYNGTINYIEYNWFTGYRERTYSGNIVKYGKKNDDVTNIIITGDGSSVIDDNDYIESVGEAIKAFESGVNSYIIGYANNLGTHIAGIGESIGTSPENIYRYDDPDFDLDEVFRNIATDIMADFWLAAGPQIME